MKTEASIEALLLNKTELIFRKSYFYCGSLNMKFFSQSIIKFTTSNFERDFYCSEDYVSLVVNSLCYILLGRLSDSEILCLVELMLSDN